MRGRAMECTQVLGKAASLIGSTRERSHYVTEQEIIRFAQASGCPFKRIGDEIEAPLLFTQALTYEALPLEELPPDGSPRELDVPIPATRTVGGSSEYEIFRKLRAGELVTIRSSIRNISARKGRSGVLYLVEVETCFSDATGETVARELATYIKRQD